MERQLNFEFVPPEPQNENHSQKPDFESLPYEDLCILYKDKVGVDPKLRSFDKPTLIAGIQNPEEELARLRKIDSDSDKEDIQRTYRS